MRKFYFILLFVFAFTSLLFASFNDGMTALNNKDYKKAFEDFLPEAKAGNPVAQNYLGIFYSKGVGVERNYSKAVYWYSKAANQNDSVAINNLANLMVHGLGVKQNLKEAIKLYEKSISLGNNLAMYNLAYMYRQGLGVEKNISKSLDLYKQSAENGFSYAENFLGYIYYFGKLGIHINYRKALSLLTKAAKSGLPVAQNNLGNIYYEGKADNKDYIEAYKWYYIAYHNEYFQAKTGIDILNGKMKKEDIDKAIKLADEWMRSHKEIDSKLTSVNLGVTLSAE